MTSAAFSTRLSSLCNASAPDCTDHAHPVCDDIVHLPRDAAAPLRRDGAPNGGEQPGRRAQTPSDEATR
jgi:hypothetical protein